MRTPIPAALGAASLFLSAGALVAQAASSEFESTQTHSIAVSQDGTRLAVVNTPDASVAVFSLADPLRPRLLREIPTALEPVSIRFRDDREVWVVCQLADAVQVVDIDQGVVTATLRVGNEPADVAFAGGKAFVSTAHPAEVVVLDATARTESSRIALDCAEPRWLLASADGQKVWVASHLSGNRTTIVPADRAPAQQRPTNPALPLAPQTGLIVDSRDPAWSQAHGVALTDWDVLELDVGAESVARRFSDVGTVLFGMAESGSGELLVANTEALNLVRYEPNLRGHFVDNRLTRIDLQSGTARAVDLNPGLDYQRLPNPFARATALAQPTDVLISPDQNRTYVAAFGTDRIGVLDRTGRVVTRIEIGPGGSAAVDPAHKRGPRAMAHHPSSGALYVLNRLANSVSVVDTLQLRERLEIELFDPTPVAVREGRGFLYDARLSGNGTAACAACHVDGGVDGLAWDLGDPSGDMVTVQTPRTGAEQVHPMKGPLQTQSLRGLLVDGSLHWRGEKNGLVDFNGTFDALMGGTPLDTADFARFRSFVAALVNEPNPNRNLDDTLPSRGPHGGNPNSGKTIFENGVGIQYYANSPSCTSCHNLAGGVSAQPIDAATMRLPQPFRAANLNQIYRRIRLPDVNNRTVTRGFGISFDGRHDDVVGHLSQPTFFGLSAAQRTDVQAFLESFDTGTKPAVGRARLVDSSNWNDAAVAGERSILRACAQRRDCDLIGVGEIDGAPVGLLWNPASASYLQDRAGAPTLDVTTLDGLFQQGRARILFSGVVPGTGRARALDRDLDGVLDGDARSAVTYGTASGAAPAELRTNVVPELGAQDFAVVVEHAPADAQGAVLLGFGRADFPVPGGLRLLIDPNAVFGFSVRADARGVAMLPVPLPQGSQYDGLQLHAQSVFLGSQGISASQGLEITLQD